MSDILTDLNELAEAAMGDGIEWRTETVHRAIAEITELRRRNAEVVREHDGLRRSEREWRKKLIAVEGQRDFATQYAERLEKIDIERLLELAEARHKIERYERAIKSMDGEAGDAIRKVTGLEDTL